jgi:hypothetical protein
MLTLVEVAVEMCHQLPALAVQVLSFCVIHLTTQSQLAQVLPEQLQQLELIK